MEPLITTKRILMWICMYPIEKSSNNKWKAVARIIFVAVLFVTTVCVVLAYTAFIVETISTDLGDVLFTLMAFTTCCNLIYAMIVAFFTRHDVPSIFEPLTTIYDADMDIEAHRILIQANEKCEWMCSVYKKCVLSLIVDMLITTAGSILINWLIDGSLIVDHFYRPCKTILPWNQATILGYLSEQILVENAAFVFSIINGVLLQLFISICIHHQAFHQIIRNWIGQWNCSIRNHSDEIDRKFICNIIQFHILFKKLFLVSAAIYSPFLVGQLITGVFLLAVSMFHVDLLIQNENFIAIPIVSMAVLCGIMILFPYCYFGKLATDSFEQMSDCVYDLNWPELPIALQKYIILMLANMNRPIFYHGFHIAFLDLNTFVRLLKSVISYYLMFKTLTSQE